MLRCRSFFPLRKVASLAAATVLSIASLVSHVDAAKAAPSQVDASKYAAVVVDTATGKVLYEANPDSRRFPASLTKMMTLYVMFEDLQRGRFKMSTPLKVSALAQRQKPTKLGLRAGETITVEDAVLGLITRSANDAAAVIAENVAGSVPAFADRMTRTARALGMSRTHFNNPNGLPDPDNFTTARDMMKLGVALQVRFPQYFQLFATKSYVYRGRVIGNHNRLLGRVDGVDGIKTGYVNASGFNIVTSVKRDGRRLVVVVMGGKSAAARDVHVVNLINTYLPRASRSGGFASELIAAVKAAPRAAEPPAQPEVTASIPQVNHPLPSRRPADAAGMSETTVAMVDPADLMPPASIPDVPATVTRGLDAPAPVAEAPVIPPMPLPDQAPGSLADAKLPASLANARLPSSAVEAFADITPQPRPDPLASLVDKSQGEASYQVASLVEVPAPAPEAPKAVAAPKPRSQQSDADEAASAPASGWYIQIGAVGSTKDAKVLLDKARNAAKSALADADAVTQTVSKGGQTIVRARFAGFDSEKAANKACAALKKNEFSCFTIRL